MSETITVFSGDEHHSSERKNKESLSPAIGHFFLNLFLGMQTETDTPTPLLPEKSQSSQNLETEKQKLFDDLAKLSLEISQELESQTSPLNFFKNLIDDIQGKILSKIAKPKFRDDLNIFFWHQQIQEIFAQNENEKLAQNKAKAMIKEDLRHFTLEYLLQRKRAAFELEISGEQISTESYQHSSLTEACEKFADIKKEKGTITRPEMEALIYGDFLNNWFQLAPQGERLMIISPPGTKKEGYPGLDSYSFIFVYEILPFSDPLDKKAKVTMHRQWVTPEESWQLLEAVSEQEVNRTSQEIMLSPVVISPNISNEEFEKLMNQIYSENTSEKNKEVEVSEAFWQDFDLLYEEFFLPKIEELLQKEDPSEEDWLTIESALNFWQRAVIDSRESKKLDNDEQKTINLEKLEAAWEIFYKGKILKEKISKTEKENYLGFLEIAFGNSGGLKGASQQIVSIGSCASGIGPSLAIKGVRGFNMNKGLLDPSLLSMADKEKLNGKYICKLCGEILTNPGLCPICGDIDYNEFSKIDFGNLMPKKKAVLPKKNISPPKSINTPSSNNSESASDFFSNLLGNQSSVSASSLLTNS